MSKPQQEEYTLNYDDVNSVPTSQGPNLQENNVCLFRDLYETYKNIVWTECSVYVSKPLCFIELRWQ